MNSAHRTDWVMPILVAKTGTHEGTVAAAALAASLAFVEATGEAEEAYSAWLAGPFTKTVRRAPASWLDRARDEHGGTEVVYGLSRAVALDPVRMTALPKVVAGAQVAGTDFERTRPPLVPLPTDGLAVEVAVLSTLTTGKAAAQAAHALMGWVLGQLEGDPQHGRLRLPAAVRAALAAPGGPRVRFVPPFELAGLEVPGNVAIRDNGLTEVDANTLTAVAVPIPEHRR